MDTKPTWQSKTLWISLIGAIAAFFPTVQSFIASHAEGFTLVTMGIFGGLRMISKGKITIT